MKNILFLAGGLLFLCIFFTHLPSAAAHSDLIPSGGGVPFPGTITATPSITPLNSQVKITHCAPDDSDVQIVVTPGLGFPFLDLPPVLTSPSGSTFIDSAHTFPMTIPAGMCHETLVPKDFGGLSGINEAGQWAYRSDVEVGDFGTFTMVTFFDTSFLVLPESPIGAISLIGASMTVLGMFVVKHNRKHSHEYSDGDGQLG